MSACKLDESARFQKPFAPQYVDEHVLKRMCKEGKAGANAECSSLDSNARGLSPVQVPEPSLDFERSRAAKLVKQACLTRKQENLNRVHDQIREREEKMMMRDKAKVENSILNREDWMQRCRAVLAPLNLICFYRWVDYRCQQPSCCSWNCLPHSHCVSPYDDDAFARCSFPRYTKISEDVIFQS